LDKVLAEPEAAQHVQTPLPVEGADLEVLEEVMRAEIPVVSVVLMVAAVVAVVMVSQIRVAVAVEH
jgi:hypothetical protein